MSKYTIVRTGPYIQDRRKRMPKRSRAERDAAAELRTSENVELGATDHERFFSALESPPKPNAALKKLFAEGRGRRG
jgi:hypothetical protein